MKILVLTGLLLNLAVASAAPKPGCVAGVNLLAMPVSSRACTWESQAAALDDAIAIKGPREVIFTVRSGDVWDKEMASNPSERSELKQHYKWPMGSDMYFAYDIEFLEGMPSASTWVVLGQIHQSPNPEDYPKVSPPFAVYILDHDRLSVSIRSSQQFPIESNPTAKELLSIPGINSGQTYRLAFRVRYRSDEDGAVDGWLNGKQRIRYRGPVGYPARTGPYLKFGIYRGRAADTLRIAYRNVRFGDSPEVLGRLR